jgi:Protein of unknown function (DUF4235)
MAVAVSGANSPKAMLNSKQRWAVLVTASSIIAAQLVEYLMSSSWRAATLKEPPDDPNYQDAPWGRVLLWTAAMGAAAGMADIVSRRGSELAWRRVTGKKPPRPKRRPRITSRRAALVP